MTVLLSLPKQWEQAAPLVASMREILLREFEALSTYDREYLLQYQWDTLRDPSLVPALERMLAQNRSPQDYQVRTAALKRLLDLDKQRARPFVVAELRDVTSFVDLDVLATLEEETLPEADDALLAQIRALAPLRTGGESVWLRQRILLAARFASPAVYDGLMDVYRESGAKWTAELRGGLLGYFERYNPAQSAPLVVSALAELPPGQEQAFLVELTRSNYNDSIEALLRTRLEESEPYVVGTAAYVLSLHGAESDRTLIEARLARWQKEWGGRVAELDAEGSDAALSAQGMVEVNLVSALLLGERWKLTDEESHRLKNSCMTQACKRYYSNR